MTIQQYKSNSYAVDSKVCSAIQRTALMIMWLNESAQSVQTDAHCLPSW